MTPFGARIRELRRERGATLKDMAEALDVSSAYLSALEHGRRGRPTWALMQSILQYFNIIWDEADELIRLAELSHPRIVIDTAGLSPEATLLANRLARDIGSLPAVQVRRLLLILGERDESVNPKASTSENSASS
ncbi:MULTISPECIES: helix-turn-helix transcriptional regulator [unclassified Chelatococcus]|uniref:helix-turn-helix domain-containing protein n=1 Tax=unclassified Chelatococcus TaxID=2638111 RepID=UPI001BD1AEF6|nr:MULTISPECIES: helix-turn-helix transcriptional regulator [unclassified Chelatococcus]MBS7696952.1 helix-turn-helix transcriptional regulator [Chelatococcus sp. YT9]MBX3555942.1 helix-turn-helix transcriptional regulator [Chelatococcus sp.]